MKFIVFLFLVTVQLPGYAQDAEHPFFIPNQVKDSMHTEIQLAKTIDVSRMGIWETGAYKISIPLQQLEDGFRKDYASLMDALEHQYQNDTAAAARCKLYADRYLIAINELKDAVNGYDLKQLVVYIGPDNEAQNKGNSSTVDVLVRQSVENGNVVVYYKGKRIHSLHKLVQWDAVMSAIRIYHSQRDDCAYNYIGHVNW